MQQLIDVINLLNYICHFFAAARQPACRFSPLPTASHPRSCCTQWEASTNGQKSVVGSQFMGQRNCVWAEEERDVSSLACAASADGNRLATGQLYCGSISFQPLLIGKARSPSAARNCFSRALFVRHSGQNGWVIVANSNPARMRPGPSYPGSGLCLFRELHGVHPFENWASYFRPLRCPRMRRCPSFSCSFRFRFSFAFCQAILIWVLAPFPVPIPICVDAAALNWCARCTHN